MERISIEIISRISSNVYRDIDITTYSYIQYLLIPLVTTMENFIDIDELNEFLTKKFGIYAKAAIIYIKGSGYKLDEAINYIIEYLILDIVKHSGGDIWMLSTMLPWDILNFIKRDRSMRKIFNIDNNSETLPVTITVNDKPFEYHLTMEFVVGLLLFSLITDKNFNIIMFGQHLKPDFLKVHDDRFKDGFYKYMVDIEDTTYTFNTPDFMQGFITGALWSNVDHRIFWKNLIARAKPKILLTF